MQNLLIRQGNQVANKRIKTVRVWYRLTGGSAIILYDHVFRITFPYKHIKGNSSVTDGFPVQSPAKHSFFLCCYPKQSAKETVELSVIWDANNAHVTSLHCYSHVRPRLFHVPCRGASRGVEQTMSDHSQGQGDICSGHVSYWILWENNYHGAAVFIIKTKINMVVNKL